MMNDIKNELTETEMEKVAGGLNHTMREMKIKLEEDIKKGQEDRKQGAQAHESGASGGW